MVPKSGKEWARSRQQEQPWTKKKRGGAGVRVVAVIIVFIVSIGLLALTSHWMTLELIVQPAAKDAIGEMGVRSG